MGPVYIYHQLFLKCYIFQYNKHYNSKQLEYFEYYSKVYAIEH